MIRLNKEQRRRFGKLLYPFMKDDRIKSMKDFIHHGSRSTYTHCVDVARTAFWLNEKLRMRADEKMLVRGAMLHDYFLYDWHDHGDKLHGYHHPKIAARNAKKDFDISDHEKKMIESHMWPLTLFHPPCSKEGWLLTAADKIISSQEVIKGRIEAIKN